MYKVADGGQCLLLCVAAVQFYAVKKRFPQFISAHRADKRQKRLWTTLALPLVTLTLFANLFGDVAIVYSGLFLDAIALAPLAISVKLAFLVGFLSKLHTKLSSQTSLMPQGAQILSQLAARLFA
jgi:hypothetical protein